MMDAMVGVVGTLQQDILAGKQRQEYRAKDRAATVL